MVGVVNDLRPVGLGQAHGELVGVERGPRDHGENLAGVRVHGDQCAVLAFHHLLRHALQIEVDGEPQVLARLGKLLSKLADFLAVAVDDDIARAVHAAQQGVVGLFHAGFSDYVAGLVEVELGAVQVLLGDLAHVADQVGREAVARVEAALVVDGLQFGQLVAMGLDEGLLILGNVLLQRDGLVLGLAGIASQSSLNLLDGKVQAAGDERNVGLEVFDLVAQQVAGDRGVVIDQDAAFAVEDLAARGAHRLLAHAVGLRQLPVVVHAQHLEAPHSRSQYSQHQHHHVLGGVELARGNLLIAGDMAVGIWIRGYQIAGSGYSCSGCLSILLEVYDFVAWAAADGIPAGARGAFGRYPPLPPCPRKV